MNDDGILGGALNQLGQAVKQSVKQAIKIPQEFAKDAGEQIGGTKQPAAPAEGQVPSGEGKKQWQSDEERIKFLKDLYGGSDPSVSSGQVSKDAADPNKNKNANANPQASQKLTEFQEQIKDKSPEEQKKLIELRNQLHKEVYYDPTFNPVKKQEERPAEKVENEKKKEMMDLQQKEEKKPKPIAVVREQNKAEMFRGAAG